jgi:hypothetical protein
MKTTMIQLIKEDLLSDELNTPLLVICKISRLFINKDLIGFINRLISESKDMAERERILIKLKKLILQTPREPDQTQLEAEPAEFAQFFNEIKKEQEFYDPIKWINAELEYLKSIKSVDIKDAKANENNNELKEWLSRAQVLQLFNISKTTLNRRIAEGMPGSKLGGRQMFNRQKISDWLTGLN